MIFRRYIEQTSYGTRTKEKLLSASRSNYIGLNSGVLLVFFIELWSIFEHVILMNDVEQHFV